jgi:Flp pilus assembly protein TadG
MSGNSTQRRGSLSIETLLLIPLGLALILGVVEFGLLLTTQHLLDSASAQAVRIAARHGSDDDLRRAVHAVLGEHRFTKANVFVTSANKDGTPLRTGDLVEVRVEVLARDVVPNLLVFIGFGLGDKMLTGRAILRME